MITCSSRAAQSRPTRIRMLRNALCAAACILLAAHQHAFAQNDSNPLMQGRGGDLIFPTSCGGAVQPRFDAALAALHSFWYKQAREEFTAITQSDPDCAKARAAARKSPRESDYIEALAVFYTDSDKLDHRSRALAYSKKMEAVAQNHPDDREARIFYALSLLASADPLDKTYKNQLAAGAILEKLFAEIPTHPGVAHYIIHAYDYPDLVERALAAALKYQVCVTVVPHAVHMPSHT